MSDEDQTWGGWAPAVVFGSLTPGLLRVILHPGSGMADGGIRYEIPMERVPFELRMPNTRLSILLSPRFEILEVRPASPVEPN